MPISCSICFDAVPRFWELAVLPCGHVFHEICLIEWLHTSPTCPKCRMPVLNGKNVIRLFMDLESGVGEHSGGSLPATKSSEMFLPTAQDFLTMVEATRILCGKIAVQEDMAKLATAKTATVEQILQEKTKETNELLTDLARLRVMNEKMNTDSKKKKLKMEIDTILKGKLRTNNKELRQHVRQLKKEVSRMSVELATKGRNADQMYTELTDIHKKLNELSSNSESDENVCDSR